MGQKVNPHGLRVGVIKDWDSRWFTSKRDFGDTLVEDYKLRKAAEKAALQCRRAQDRDRAHDRQPTGKPRVRVTIHCSKPGMVIGRAALRRKSCRLSCPNMYRQGRLVNIVEVSNMSDANAQLVAEDIASQLERRIAFRRATKMAMRNAMSPRRGSGAVAAKGIKIQIGGRLNGADIARSESYHEGTIPLQTLRADIDYGFAEADTTYGKIGIKVWIYKGEVLKGAKPRARKEGGNK